MKVGFTGTQYGTTSIQRTVVRQLLISLEATEFHHGDCIGADEQAHQIALDLGIAVHLHPPNSYSKRAFVEGCTRERKPAPYLVRNHVIVKATQVLIATPKESREVLRSGTWATIRYAKKLNRKIYVVGPDGRLISP